MTAPIDRGEIALRAPFVLMAFDQLQTAFGMDKDQILATIAAALASMSEGDRAVFRALYDKIEEEMHPLRASDGSLRPKEDTLQ